VNDGFSRINLENRHIDQDAYWRHAVNDLLEPPQ
jgi:hypothetical protein